MKYMVTLNQKTFEVEVEEGEAILLNEYAAPAATPAAPAPVSAPAPAPAPAAASAAPAAPASGETINSPLPGTVLRVNVSNGQSVKSGDILLVLEAMKMENEILAPRDCTVSQVMVTPGATVDTGTPLVVLG